MKLASLFSGGKDSTYAIYMIQKKGHKVACLLSIFPKSEESHLLHHPNLTMDKFTIRIYENSTTNNLLQILMKLMTELFAIENLLINAKKKYHIEGIGSWWNQK